MPIFASRSLVSTPLQIDLAPPRFPVTRRILRMVTMELPFELQVYVGSERNGFVSETMWALLPFRCALFVLGHAYIGIYRLLSFLAGLRISARSLRA